MCSAAGCRTPSGDEAAGGELVAEPQQGEVFGLGLEHHVEVQPAGGLAEEVLGKLQPFFPGLKGDWTDTETLPGGNVAHFNAFRDEMQKKYSTLGRELVEGVVRRHGNRATSVLGEAKRIDDLGRHFGAGLTQREVEYLIKEEFASTAEDILWRRTKCGLHMTAEQRQALTSSLPS